MSAQAFVDESGRGPNYHVCAAVVANGDVDALRRLVRSFCMPGQRRWHFVHERDSRRRQIIDALVATGQATALIFHGHGRDGKVRAECFHRMVQPLLDRSVTRLIIESREGRDELDRQVLISELRHRAGAFGYDHMPPHGDPLLWVADAVAWCSSAGGAWRDRVAPIIGLTQNVTDV
ncbi:MAG: hypothetical protein Q8P61_01695 [Candidatus Nanopelagicales bacterium]|nr:hypothetical protein [Candidatus Nanopelagicales bacterium]